MRIHILIYYILLFIACMATINPARRETHLRFFLALLGSALIEELIFEILERKTGKQYFIIYTIYAPVYYTLFATYFYKVLPSIKLKRIIPYSIGFYIGGSLVAHFKGDGIFLFPGLQIDILGFLLIPQCLLALYTLNVKDKNPIYRRPLFWIAVSTFIFYTSDFIVIGLKANLAGYNNNQAKQLYEILNTANNYLYYLLIIIGMILCSSSTRPSPPR